MKQLIQIYMQPTDPAFRAIFENLLDDLHELKLIIKSDYDGENKRVVMLEHHTIKVTVIHEQHYDGGIAFDVYSELNAGIYELGELHSLTRKMLNIKKACMAYTAREMNTTERLYPENRQGKMTQTSGL